MDAPLVLKFIVKLMSDDAFRMEVLRQEMKTMEVFGLTEIQALAMRSMDSQRIYSLLLAEAAAAGADVVKTRQIMDRVTTCDAITPFAPLAAMKTPAAAPMAMAQAAMYEEGLIHLHCVDASPASGGGVSMWIRGHGIGTNPEFEFRLAGSPTKTSGTTVLPVQVGNDLFQRVRVDAPLLSGTWNIFVRNTTSESFDAMTAQPILQVVIP